MNEKRFAQMLRDRRPRLTEDDIALGRSQNIYQGPYLQGPLKEPRVYVPLWAIGLFFALFLAGVGGLLWMLS